MDISNSLDIKSPNSLQNSSLVEPKNNIININLANEDFPVHFLGEECCVNFPYLEALLNEEVPKPLILSSRSLFETIESLGQPVDMLGVPRVFKTVGLLSIDKLISVTILKSTFYIHLKQFNVMARSIYK